MSENVRKLIVPEHVFISFSQKDKETAEAIVYTLCRKNIPVWIDYAKLVPGTPDWETAIRDAIEKSFGVIVLASPESRKSKYVRGELSIADSRGCQIYPVWIEGTNWSDCIPLGMTYTQYIDAREKRREQGIAELAQILTYDIQNATPKHYYVAPLQRMIAPNDETSAMRPGWSLSKVVPPPGFVSVELTKGDENRPFWQESGSAAFIRVSEYPCVQAFLDELYINYLKDRLKPFTYGSTWILEEQNSGCCNLLLVPWSWLVGPHSDSQLDSQWLHNRPLNECGLYPGTSWRLRMTTEVMPTGFAINDERILGAMRRSPKAVFALRVYGVLMTIR